MLFRHLDSGPSEAVGLGGGEFLGSKCEAVQYFLYNSVLNGKHYNWQHTSWSTIFSLVNAAH